MPPPALCPVIGTLSSGLEWGSYGVPSFYFLNPELTPLLSGHHFLHLILGTRSTCECSPAFQPIDSSAPQGHNLSFSFSIWFKLSLGYVCEINIDRFSEALRCLLCWFPFQQLPHLLSHPLLWEPLLPLLSSPSTCSTPSPGCCLHPACLRISSGEESVPVVVWCLQGKELARARLWNKPGEHHGKADLWEVGLCFLLWTASMGLLL